MNTSQRAVLALLIAAIVFFLGVLFWPFVLNNILEPTALAVWLLLRILVLSIDQKYFWYAVILLAVFFLFRLVRPEQPSAQPKTYSDTNATIINIGYWRVLFMYDNQDVHDEKILKRELTHLVTALYTSKQNMSPSFQIYDALQQGEIPLPEHIRSFLFSTEPDESRGPITTLLQSIQKTLRKRIRQSTGQEKAEHYRMIDEVLGFVETSLEIKNDDKNFVHNEH